MSQSNTSISALEDSKVSAVFLVSDNEDEEEMPLSETPYLDEYEPNANIASFLDKEITVGKFIGQGRFTESYQVKSFRRDIMFQAKSVQDERNRLELSETAKNNKKGSYNYSLKQVRGGLMTEREVERAALGLTIEANYLSRLDHANIIALKGTCETTVVLDGDVYEYHAIITNRITETLDQRIDYWNSQDSVAKDSDFILHLKTDYAFQIADALSYLHKRRIIFRNLTLSSIGFTTSDTIQLINFDCVKELPEGQDCLHDGFKGSQTYAALEIYSGRPYDFKVDCFAWAICFYEMLTQEPAFTTTTNEEALIREHGWCPSLQDCDYIPDGLLDLLEDSWETNVEERISMADIRRQLEWILFGTGEDSDEDTSTNADSGADFFSNTQKNNKAKMEGDLSASEFFFLEDMSALGLDLSESANFAQAPQPQAQGGRGRRGSVNSVEEINAALGFSGCRNSFLPAELLLDAKDATNLVQKAASATPQQQALAAEALLPKLEYTSQFRGLRIETIPPPCFVPQNVKNKQSRRRSMQRTEMAVCA
ncbi:activated protein kinase kinase kinase dlk-1 [Seminavis robusta]|uniref:Activated protein kinase kinase kinase dlk-1 n=1 Tax=Seminavis robusta TaxID=568900 RepID=A0A9N8H936_9STRA|nr:activated protein kinase kinase kinase dlk-1 [Seminavis robusta]|eukprot:Sro106_g053590.1 activated protein kinase kinase kinase dlk-1 (540) ;mRNA; r:70566-72185